MVVTAPVNTCPAATGSLSGDTLGLLTLGMTREEAIGKYGRTSSRVSLASSKHLYNLR